VSSTGAPHGGALRSPSGRRRPRVTSGAFLLELRTRSEIADGNRKLCPLVALLIPDIGGREPTTEYGRQLADQARLLYAAYGCPKRSA
jgi:hypothetical protein